MFELPKLSDMLSGFTTAEDQVESMISEAGLPSPPPGPVKMAKNIMDHFESMISKSGFPQPPQLPGLPSGFPPVPGLPGMPGTSSYQNTEDYTGGTGSGESLGETESVPVTTKEKTEKQGIEIVEA